MLHQVPKGSLKFSAAYAIGILIVTHNRNVTVYEAVPDSCLITYDIIKQLFLLVCLLLRTDLTEIWSQLQNQN